MNYLYFRIAFITTFLCFLLPAKTKCQVVLNEIDLDISWVELQNVSDTTVNISQYYLASGNSSFRVNTYFPACGGGFNFDLEPGEIFAFDGLPDFSFTDGEVILFKNDSLDNPSSVLSYVQWGFAGHAHEAIADSADVWLSGDFVPALLEGGSLEYGGSGNQSSDWESAAVNSLCEANGTGCNVSVGTVIPGSNPFHVCIGNAKADGFGFTFHGNLAMNLATVVLDGTGRILAVTYSGMGGVDLEWITPEDTNGIHAIWFGHNGPIANLEVGEYISNLVGCFDHSDPVPVMAQFIDQGDLIATYNDTVYTSEIEICATDDIPDYIHFQNTSVDSQVAFVAYNKMTNRVLAIGIDSMSLNFEEYPFPEIIIRGLSYLDTLQGEIGDIYFSVRGSSCWTYTTNEILVQTDICINAAQDTKNSSNSSLVIFPNPVISTLTISKIATHKSIVRIYDTFGHCVHAQDVYAEPGSIEIPVQHLTQGLYFVQVNEGQQNIIGRFIKQ